MLQRAASNAYSWWWASHIRTKQSKWLEQNLQDFGEKVQIVLKLIEEDGDSFAKRAEMYYKKRPELIHFVEESYRAYRALAERYDHISTELQNANTTIASVFPEQVQFAMEDDEDEASPRVQKKGPENSKGNIPKVPKIPKSLKSIFSQNNNKAQTKQSMKPTNQATVNKSGLSKTNGLLEIDKLQKQILALQTEKEFVKSSYEGGLAKYWEIEQMITEMQEKVCTLQDEFGAGTVIEDDEARTLMASAALKSCQDTLAQLQEKQEKSAGEAMVENKRINEARQKLKSLKHTFLQGEVDQETPKAKESCTKAAGELKSLEKLPNVGAQERKDLEILREKISEHFEAGSNSSLSASELAEKIDELVNKVINLEAAVSSQTALINRLRMETDELQGQIGILEDDKATLIDGKNDLRGKLREMEQKLNGIQELNQNVEDQNNNIQTHFTEAHCNLDNLSEKLHDVKADDEIQATLQTEWGTLDKVESQQEQEGSLSTEYGIEKLPELNSQDPKEQESGLQPDAVLEEELKISDSLEKEKEPVDEVTDELKVRDSSQKEESTTDDKKEVEGDLSTSERNQKENESSLQTKNESDNLPENFHDKKSEEKAVKQDSPETTNSLVPVETPERATAKQDEELDWKHLFTNGMENREKYLLSEYTTALRNYKDAKKKLGEAEKKNNGDGLFEMTVQLRELKASNAKKDEQIKLLRQKLSLFQTSLGEDNESEQSTMTESSTVERDVILIDQSESEAPLIEQKFRASIDEVLEENLDFWLRFSGIFHQIQKFETETKDLHSELVKLEEKKKKQDGSSAYKYSLKSDAKPLYRHLREIYAQLSVWLEKSAQLKDELKSRFSSLCDIQDEITSALKESAEDEDFTFTSYQAAKFQGEILNMKQENNKVADELQAGLDHVTTLQLEVEKSLGTLNDEFKLSGSKHVVSNGHNRSESRSRVPLRSFIFGIKPKKQRHSIFSCVHPVLQRKYNGLKSMA